MKITGENEINMYKELKEQIDRWQIEKRDAHCTTIRRKYIGLEGTADIRQNKQRY